jgi:GGDEF domain-containing protein
MDSPVPSPTVVAARQAAWLFAVRGLLALLAAPVEPGRAGALLTVGGADLLVVAVTWALPTTTFSAGTAEHRPGDYQATTLGRADTALYRAKQDGRNRVIAASLTG